MANAATVQRVDAPAGGAARLVVQGPLTFDTAAAAWRAGQRALEGCDAGAVDIDCAGIERADSAGLAVLIEWLAWGQRHDRVVRLQGLPTTLVDIARISELEDLVQPPLG
ncbi:MAG: STAS domain-containing protein [Steroidobacteraceae bacterium]